MIMEYLYAKKINNFELQDYLIRVVDIINFEGPLLTLYEDIVNNQFYLLDWVDRDAQFNRWLIYKTNIQVLKKYLSEDISHFDLFNAVEQYCYVVDIDENIKWTNPRKLKKDSLPENYYPLCDVYFEEDDCPNFNKLKLIIDGKSIQQEKLLSNLTSYKNHNSYIYPNIFNKHKIDVDILDNSISLAHSSYKSSQGNIILQYNNKVKPQQTIKQNSYV